MIVLDTNVVSELMRTEPSATPHHSSGTEPRVESSAPSARRRTLARSSIASRSGDESLENHEPASMLERSSIVRTGWVMFCL